MAHTTGLFLAAVALLLVVSADVPKMNHSTSLDNVIFMTVLLLVVTCAHFVVEEHALLASDMEANHWFAFSVYVVGYGAFVLSEVVPPYRRRIQGTSGLKALTDEEMVPVVCIGRACKVPPADFGAQPSQKETVEDAAVEWNASDAHSC